MDASAHLQNDPGFAPTAVLERLATPSYTDFVRIGIVSDIHCNAEGLRTGLTAMGDIDALLCPGDLIYAYQYSREVVSVLRERDARVVLGNHELGFLANGLADKEPDRDGVEYLRGLPLSLDFELAGKRFVMLHASPFDREHQYLYEPSLNFDLSAFQDTDADYLIVGHTHTVVDQKRGRTRLINPGSAGEPRPVRGELLLSCAVLDVERDEVVFLTYGVEPSSQAQVRS
jgi:putative phosphoesterase